MTSRQRYYGEVKSWPSKYMKIKPEALEILNKYRGPKSWTDFMTDIATMLDSQPEKSGK